MTEDNKRRGLSSAFSATGCNPLSGFNANNDRVMSVSGATPSNRVLVAALVARLLMELQPLTGAAWKPFDGTLMIRVNGSTLESDSRISYDNDRDGLIEIGDLAQLNAVRWDLDGDGAVVNGTNADAYSTAFPNAAAGMGCPTTSDDADEYDCLGYELIAGLDFDANGDGAVDADDNCWNSGTGWLPIRAFAAVFEGNGHAISNLYINRSTGRVGLFEYVKAGAQVRNVGVRDVAVTGSGENQSIGGIVGFNAGSIVASYATGLAVGGVESNVGGLVGRNRGSIADSYAEISAKCDDESDVGALVGSNAGNIADSYGTGIVGWWGETQVPVTEAEALSTPATRPAMCQAWAVVPMSAGSWVKTPSATTAETLSTTAIGIPRPRGRR